MAVPWAPSAPKVNSTWVVSALAARASWADSAPAARASLTRYIRFAWNNTSSNGGGSSGSGGGGKIGMAHTPYSSTSTMNITTTYYCHHEQ